MIGVNSYRKRNDLKKTELEWRKAICGICPAGCWVEVALENGKLVDIRADISHTLGVICRRGQHAPEIVYSEHRLKYPMRRVGARGSFEFERIAWDEAYRIITENLHRVSVHQTCRLNDAIELLFLIQIMKIHLKQVVRVTADANVTDLNKVFLEPTG